MYSNEIHLGWKQLKADYKLEESGNKKRKLYHMSKVDNYRIISRNQHMLNEIWPNYCYFKWIWNCTFTFFLQIKSNNCLIKKIIND